jgi:hypothetical protein
MNIERRYANHLEMVSAATEAPPLMMLWAHAQQHDEDVSKDCRCVVGEIATVDEDAPEIGSDCDELADFVVAFPTGEGVVEVHLCCRHVALMLMRHKDGDITEIIE